MITLIIIIEEGVKFSKVKANVRMVTLYYKLNWIFSWSLKITYALKCAVNFFYCFSIILSIHFDVFGSLIGFDNMRGRAYG